MKTWLKFADVDGQIIDASVWAQAPGGYWVIAANQPGKIIKVRRWRGGWTVDTR